MCVFNGYMDENLLCVCVLNEKKKEAVKRMIMIKKGKEEIKKKPNEKKRQTSKSIVDKQMFEKEKKGMF